MDVAHRAGLVRAAGQHRASVWQRGVPVLEHPLVQRARRERVADAEGGLQARRAHAAGQALLPVRLVRALLAALLLVRLPLGLPTAIVISEAYLGDNFRVFLLISHGIGLFPGSQAFL